MAETSAPKLYDYWGPRGFALDYPVAPSRDYYRLVNEDSDVTDAIEAGEMPLHGHRGMSHRDLEHQRMLQWEGPNRLFARTPDGSVVELDAIDADEETEQTREELAQEELTRSPHTPPPPSRPTRFLPLWSSEGYPSGNVEERNRLIEHLIRVAPDMLEHPGVVTPPRDEEEEVDDRISSGIVPALSARLTSRMPNYQPPRGAAPQIAALQEVLRRSLMGLG